MVETEEDLNKMEQDMNLYYKSTTFINASTKSQLSFDLSIRKVNNKDSNQISNRFHYEVTYTFTKASFPSNEQEKKIMIYCSHISSSN